MLEANCTDPDHQQVSDLRISPPSRWMRSTTWRCSSQPPRALDDLGLTAAPGAPHLRMEVRYKVPIDLAITLGDLRLPEGVETALLPYYPGDLTNVVRPCPGPFGQHSR